MTDSVAVSGSELYADAGVTTAFVVKRSAALSLTNNKEYISQFARSAGGTGEMLDALAVAV